MPKIKKKQSCKNMLESMDQFPVEHNFKFIRKEAKGTVVGFWISAVYILLLIYYAFNRI